MKREPNKSTTNSSLPRSPRSSRGATSARGARCSHVFPSGRRCRLAPIFEGNASREGSHSPGSDSHFCRRHRPKIDPAAELIRDLSEAAGTLSTPEEIHRFLTHVTLLRIQGRLTSKEACSYAYLCQILQRGQREIAFHQKLRDDRAQRAAEQAEEEEVMSWSIPRPKRDDPVCPEPREADSPAQEVSPVPAASSDATATSVEVLPPAQPASAQTPTSFPSPSPLSPDFYNHFYPFDPTLPPGLQDPRKNIPPPDEAECRRLAARRGLNFTRRRPNSSGVLR